MADRPSVKFYPLRDKCNYAQVTANSAVGYDNMQNSVT